MTHTLSNNFLKTLNEAKVSKGGNYFRDGRYRLAIREVKVEDMNDGLTGVVEFLVLSSEKRVADQPDTPNPVGDKPSIVCKFGTNPKVAYSEFKKVIAAALQEDPETADLQALLKDVDLRGFRGVQVGLETYPGVNKGRNNPANAGKPITKMSFKAIEQTDAEIVDMRARLDREDAPPTA